MKERRDYYVYVYIDPRNFEEFYYGKGCTNRKEAHLYEVSDSNKVARIAAIRKEGEEPIIRVIARDLEESEALLVEATLIWRASGKITNVVKGHHSWRFRPANTMHTKLSNYDYYNGFFYVNVSEGAHRCWDDCRRIGFLAAGCGRQWSEQLDKLNKGDVVAAYCAGSGFVGVGIVSHRAIPASKFRFSGRRLKASDLLQPRLLENWENPELAQYLVGIEWKATVDKVADAKFAKNSGLYTPQRVVASLASQQKTKRFIENAFDLSLDSLGSSRS